MICKKAHRYLNEYNSLSEAQDNQYGDRHICAGCAYEEGLRDGINGNVKKNNFSHLPYSQAGTVRHKDAKEAYEEGYEEGRKRSS
ncbi:MAG: hypothetical protein IJZ19_02965 [Lentisphaeria bacterium]|nr:hypothetical protein [Lentisphaeria bacterium]